jgi:hypothetical protein
MVDLIKQALTRRRPRGSRAIEEPNERLVYIVKFALGMTASLAGIEIAHLVVLHTWNSEVFAAITGLIGTVTGVFIGQKTGLEKD